MIVCQRQVCWRVRTSRARSRIVALPGFRRRQVRIPVLEVAEAVLDGGAGGGQGLVGLALGGGGFAVEGGFVAGDDDGVVGVGVQAGEAEVGEGAEPDPFDTDDYERPAA